MGRQPSGAARSVAVSVVRTSARNAASRDPRRRPELAKVMVSLKIFPSEPEEASGVMDEVERRLKSIAGVSEVEVLVSRRIA